MFLGLGYVLTDKGILSWLPQEKTEQFLAPTTLLRHFQDLLLSGGGSHCLITKSLFPKDPPLVFYPPAGRIKCSGCSHPRPLTAPPGIITIFFFKVFI